ncbi:MAG TPA: hypothetical protein VH208_06480 [Myxococcaceae bacterium]|jgi:hypothetical protein|nr:hypothetical protein [Myxococcaceae bacterium]
MPPEPGPPQALPMPPRIQRLRRDPSRNLPVPWFATWLDGRPEFRYVTDGRMAQATVRGLCWTCGQPMGRNRAFVIGPMCAINRVSSDPPSHRDCALYSTVACPFLANPRSVRRTSGLRSEVADQLRAPAGIMIRRNPGVALVWVTKRYEVEIHPEGPLFRLGDPEETQWIAERRPATRDEVMASIDSGYPQLLEVAEAESPAAVLALEEMRAAAMRWVPV